MGVKSTIKLVKKILLDDDKRKNYSDPELIYMSKQLLNMKLERARKKAERKLTKGFGYQAV
jgi:hypothetical protein